MRKTCLNGYWDILPIYSENSETLSTIPTEGWRSNTYLVPSPWNKCFIGVKRKDEEYYQEYKDKKVSPAELLDMLGPEPDFLFDGFNYPVEWTRTCSAWLRRKFNLVKNPAKRYFLLLEAVSPRFKLFVNGQECGYHYDPLLPFEPDITEYIRDGENEIVLLVLDHIYDENGRTFAPSGNEFTNTICGIWQNVFLIERNDIFLEDIVIRTSFRTATLNATLSFKNESALHRSILLKTNIREWRKNGKGKLALSLPDKELKIEKSCDAKVSFEVEWKDAKLWSPETPNLYVFEYELIENDSSIANGTERFGFREVWIDGKDIMLNGHPIHIFSDWGHKVSPFHLTADWIRKWFGMIKDCNMNHSRLHTHPHPKIFLELADEMGILITGETGIHGSGGAQAADSEEFWKNAETHVRNFIRRDKNHPCIIMWSVENEMRWNRDQTRLAFHNLPKLKRLFNELDPTRPAYHEGDSSLWDEHLQDIISRHYGKECSGEGWWDGKKPLHSGEMCVYHYAGPNNTLHLGGDSVYSSYDEIDKAAALDTALIVEAGRANGVCCFGPWNISCHQNLRPCKEKITLKYGNLETPGVKPLQVNPYSSEFEFWKPGKGYFKNKSFDIQKHCFRPFAIIDTNLQSAHFANRKFHRILSLVNDTAADVEGTLTASISVRKNEIFRMDKKIKISQGHTEKVNIEFHLHANISGNATYSVKFSDNKRTYDKWTRKIIIVPEFSATKLKNEVAVVGKGQLRNFLDCLKIDYLLFDNLGDACASGRKIVIAEKNTLHPDENLLNTAKNFCMNGGRLIILEQISSIFPSMPIEAKPIMKAFHRAAKHPILKNVAESELFMWGDGSFANLSSNAFVANNLYKKFDEKHSLTIVDAGEGGFGDGDIEYSALFESKLGKGLVIASQLLICDKINEIPTAGKILLNMLKYADKYRQENIVPPIILSGDSSSSITETVRSEVESGKTLFIENLNQAGINKLNEVFGRALQLVEDNDQFQAVRIASDPLIEGISNWDTCGIEQYCYSNPKTCENFKIGNLFLVPDNKFKTVLATPTKSALKELFVYGGKTEILRSYTVSKYLYFAPEQKQFSIFGYFKYGKGRVVISQFAPEKDKPRMRRFRNRILSSLGQSLSEDTIFDGQFIESEKRSDGFPQRIYILNRNINEEEKQKIIKCTIPGKERLVSTSMFEIHGWNEVKNENGLWDASSLDISKDIYIYYHIFSPKPRKNTGSNLGIPNPEDLTFLDITGEGYIEIILNGEKIADKELEEDITTISDIPLEMYFNHFLAKWIPKTNSSKISFHWRNIMRKPENGLGF